MERPNPPAAPASTPKGRAPRARANAAAKRSKPAKPKVAFPKDGIPPTKKGRATSRKRPSPETIIFEDSEAGPLPAWVPARMLGERAETPDRQIDPAASPSSKPATTPPPSATAPAAPSVPPAPLPTAPPAPAVQPPARSEPELAEFTNPRPPPGTLKQTYRKTRDWLEDDRPWHRHWPVVVVVLFALLLRTWNTFPTFFYGDDAEYAIVANYLADDWRNLAYPEMEGFGTQPFVSQPPLLLYLFAFAGKLIGDMEVAATLVCILLGTLTCGLLYFLGYVLQGRSMGVLAGLFLALMPYHVLLSRKAYLDVGMTFFMALTILCFFVWLDRRTTGWAVATGLATAATIMSKLPGVLIVVPLVVGLVVEIVRGFARRTPTPQATLARTQLRRVGAHTGVAAAPILLIGFLYLALLWYLKSTQNLFTKLGWQWGRVSATGAESATNALAEHPWHWYLSSTVSSVPAQAGVIMTLLCLWGVAFLFWPPLKDKPTRVYVLIAWPLILLMFLTLSHRKEWFYIVPLLAPVALLAAAGVRPVIDRLRHTIGPGISGRARAPFAFVIVALLLVVAVAGAQPAFVTANTVIFKPRSYGYGIKEAAEIIHERDPEATQLGSLLGRFTLHFYNGQPTYHWFVSHDAVNESIERGELRFVVIDTHLRIDYEEAWMRQLVATYNGTLIQDWQNHKGTTKVWLYELHPGSTVLARPSD